jgi:hypothetical protein
MPPTPLLAAAGGGAVAGGLLARRRLRDLGATPEEVARALPGDDAMPHDGRTSTMATTIDAPPEAIWPWLVQMGCERGGFYSWDRLDNGGRPSADRVHPEWQGLRAGDRITSTPGGMSWFDVLELVPERTLVLRGGFDLDRRRSFPPGAPLPRHFVDGTWTFVLEPLPGGRTRLIVRAAGWGRPRALNRVASWLFWDPAHLIMQTKQFRELRRRAEASPGAGTDTLSEPG